MKKTIYRQFYNLFTFMANRFQQGAQLVENRHGFLIPAGRTPFDAREINLRFPHFEDERNMTESQICVACHGCCNYVTIELDFPKSSRARDEYRWYLLHRNVEIFIDNDESWQLLFKTPCDRLGTDGMCKVYESRPDICRAYSADGCSRTGKDHQHLFATPEELDAFLSKKKRSK